MATAFTLAAGLAVATAPTAAATNYEVEAGCSFPPTGGTLMVQPGDQIYSYAFLGGGCDTLVVTPNTLPFLFLGGNVLVFFVPLGAQPGDTWLIDMGIDYLNNFFLTVTVGEAEVATPTAATPADAAPVPSWVQAYGRSGKDVTCQDGWDASWQSWAEPVTGGWVCTRSIPSFN